VLDLRPAGQPASDDVPRRERAVFTRSVVRSTSSSVPFGKRWPR